METSYVMEVDGAYRISGSACLCLFSLSVDLLLCAPTCMNNNYAG